MSQTISNVPFLRVVDGDVEAGVCDYVDGRYTNVMVIGIFDSEAEAVEAVSAWIAAGN